MLIEKPRFIFTTTATVVLAFGYFLYLDNSADPRFSDHALNYAEAQWWELALIALCLAAVFSTLLSAIKHAFNQGRPALAILMLLVWPASFVYGLWHINRKGDHHAR